MNLALNIDKEKRILIVEDNQLTLHHIKVCLSENGYQVFPCHKPSEATELLNEMTPDLIILDIILPEMNGYDFCRWVKEQPRLKLVPVVFLTSLNSVEDRITGLKIGGDDYVTKPFSVEELLTRVQGIIQKNERYYELTMRDDLTGAYNRRYFRERLTEEFHRAKRTKQPLSIVFLDIDNFKQINDEHGHSAGDHIIIEFAGFIKNQLRINDLTARLGGDEFVLLLSGTDMEMAYYLIERLRKKLEETVFLHSQGDTRLKISLTISAGIASYPEHAEDPEKLVILADRALYDAKNSGRNSVHIHRLSKN